MKYPTYSFSNLDCGHFEICWNEHANGAMKIDRNSFQAQYVAMKKHLMDFKNTKVFARVECLQETISTDLLLINRNNQSQNKTEQTNTIIRVSD